MNYVQEYKKYKKRYIESKIQVGGVITTDLNTDTIFREAIQEIVSDTSFSTENAFFRDRDNLISLMGYDTHSMKDKYAKRDKVASYSCQEGVNRKNFYVFNTDDALKFSDTLGKYYKDSDFTQITNIVSLEDSRERKNWTSGTWAIYLEGSKFIFVMTEMNESSIGELGVKHSMLSTPHKFYLGGEFRIFKDSRDDKVYLQGNINSSIVNYMLSNISSSSRISNNRLMTYFGKLVKVFFQKICRLNGSTENYVVQIAECDIGYNHGSPSDFSRFNKLKLDPMYHTETFFPDTLGVLSYYYNSIKCPSDDFINRSRQLACTDGLKYAILKDI